MAYFPNGSAGEVLDAQCADCPLGAGWNDPNQRELFDVEREFKPCPVAFVQLQYNYEQINKGNEKLRDAMNLLINEQGECQVRKLHCEIRAEQRWTIQQQLK